MGEVGENRGGESREGQHVSAKTPAPRSRPWALRAPGEVSMSGLCAGVQALLLGWLCAPTADDSSATCATAGSTSARFATAGSATALGAAARQPGVGRGGSLDGDISRAVGVAMDTLDARPPIGSGRGPGRRK
jgi:hypothetical protein